jgi:pimeloyl-ACP methyl ester carboxylesterase
MNRGRAELRDETIRLADGRRLAFAEWGDTNGSPVLYFHAVPGSRLWFDEQATASRGVRLITVDRPGYGRSDPKEEATLLTWVDDVEQLAHALGLARFAVVAWSMGGPYALAAAAGLPDRITRVGLASISHVPSDERPASIKAPPEEDVRAAANDPEGLIARWSGSGDWRAYVEKPGAILNGLTDVDKRMLDELGYRNELEENIREGMRQGLRGMLWEEVAMLRPWGFRLSDVGAETFVWRGEHESATAREFVANHLPNARLIVWQGEGHCGFLRHWDEILSAMLG